MATGGDEDDPERDEAPAHEQRRLATPKAAPQDFWTGKRIGLAGLGLTVVAIVVAILAAAGVFSSGSGQRPVVINSSRGGESVAPLAYVPQSPPSAIDGPADIKAYALSRSFWASKPTVFDDALSVAFNDQFDNGVPQLEVDPLSYAPDVETLTDLANSAPSVEGQPVLTVGRVEAAVESTVNTLGFGIQSPHDVRLVSATGRDSIYALTDASTDLRVGAVVYLPVVVVATGQARNGSQTSYVVGLNSPSSAVGATSNAPSFIIGAARAFNRK